MSIASKPSTVGNLTDGLPPPSQHLDGEVYVRPKPDRRRSPQRHSVGGRRASDFSDTAALHCAQTPQLEGERKAALMLRLTGVGALEIEGSRWEAVAYDLVANVPRDGLAYGDGRLEIEGKPYFFAGWVGRQVGLDSGKGWRAELLATDGDGSVQIQGMTFADLKGHRPSLRL